MDCTCQDLEVIMSIPNYALIKTSVWSLGQQQLPDHHALSSSLAMYLDRDRVRHASQSEGFELNQAIRTSICAN